MHITTPLCSRLFLAVSQTLLTLALLVAPLHAQDQTSANHSNTVEFCQSQAEKVHDDFKNALKKIQANPSLLDTGEAEKAFYEFQKACTSIKNDAGQRLEIINKEVDRIKNTDLSEKDKNALAGALSGNIQKLERIRESLNKSIVYSTQSKPAEWKKIYANWLGVSGVDKAKERISTEIDSFFKELPDIAKPSSISSNIQGVGGYFSSSFQDFEILPRWVWVSLLSVVVIGTIASLLARSETLGGITFFLAGFVLFMWLLNLIWRAVTALF
jgi:hypothetical protein